MSALVAAPALLLLGGGAVAFWIWTLVDVLRVADDTRFRTGTQLVWIIVIVFTQIVGSIIYVAIGRPTSSQIR